MDAVEAWGNSQFDLKSKSNSRSFHRAGIYLFLISFACVYYVANAPLMLGHYDLGWHLAAGDLIRDRGSIPFQDPWSFTLADKQWYNLSWLWDVIASVIYFNIRNSSGLMLFVVACGAVIVGYLDVRLPAQRSLGHGGLYFRFLRVLALSGFCDGPEYLSRRFAEHVHNAVLRHFLRRMPEANEMVLVAGDDGALGQSAWRLFARLSHHWHFWRRGLAPAGLGQFQNLQPRGSGLPRRHPDQSLRLAYLRRPDGYVGPLRASLHHRVVVVLLEHDHAGQPSRHHLYVDICRRWNCASEGLSDSAGVTAAVLAVFVFGLYQFRYMSFFFIFSTVPLALHIDRLLPKRPNDFDVQKSLLAAGILGACALPLTFMHVRPALGLPQMLSEQDALYLQKHFSHARLLNNWNVGGLLIFRTQVPYPCSSMVGRLPLIPTTCCATISSWFPASKSTKLPGTRCSRSTRSTPCSGSRRTNSSGTSSSTSAAGRKTTQARIESVYVKP